ncbi:uncharacterized protein LOC141851557 [Brevipalpus obovatus]|uniref:uncharacterized protein LOC141851557 n=1 Tax=Brevipalpus obovatus TaxID=246614 RepID=UPI003D9E277A
MCYSFDQRTKTDDCKICGRFQSICYGFDCVSNFVDYILDDLSKRLATKKGNVSVIAHNSRGYDGHFIFRDIFSRNLTDVRPILNGNKILKIDLNNVRFLDSLSFFQQPLDSLPKTFGLDCSLIVKGVFPHLFNTEENQDYEGPLPGIKYFSPEFMKEKKQDELLAWFEDNKDKVWNLKAELIKYCANDVLILRMCVMEFRSLVKRMVAIDPLTRSFTLASVAREIFRAKMLVGGFMAITPPKGYSERYSSIERCAWLDMLEILRRIKLRREFRVGPYFVDGYCHETGENIFLYGHPEVICRDFDYTLDQYFGFVKCLVLPPRDLFIQVLPTKSDGKLVFHLCSKCSEEKNQQTCSHSDSEHAILGTWTTPELRLAIEKGYSILDIKEVHNYKKPITNIFAEYIKLWLKEKQEASEYPSWVQNEEDKDRYLQLYKDEEGVELEKEKITRNEGRRSIAKAMLNSLWGRFALRKNQMKTCLVTDYAEYWRILNDPKLQVQSEYNPTDQSVLLQYKFESDDDDEEFAARNIAVAAFLTSYARTKLYQLIDEIESARTGRVLYFDTDSVIFVEKDSDEKIKTGDFLRELTDELQGYGSGVKCTKFSSCGPKNYGYEITMSNGETKATMKTKGIRLSAQALEIINFEKMLEMAYKLARGEGFDLKIPQFRIKTTTASHILFSETIEKIYRVVSDKRRLDEKCTLPYGYRSR